MIAGYGPQSLIIERALHKLIEFIRSTYLFVLFVVLEVLAINYYAHSTSYTEARLLTRANSMVGGVHGLMADIRSYFHLSQVNDELLDYVARLSEKVAGYEELIARDSVRQTYYVSPATKSKFRVIHASVISNTVNRERNLVVLNCGRKDGVREDMTLLSPEGALVGYVADCSENYSVAVSILSVGLKLNGRLKVENKDGNNNEGLGTLVWDGLDPEVMMMKDVSKYDFPEVGQAVVSAGLEISFGNVPIGTIEQITMNETETRYNAKVRLTAPFSSLSKVLLVERVDKGEIDELKKSPKLEHIG